MNDRLKAIVDRCNAHTEKTTDKDLAEIFDWANENQEESWEAGAYMNTCMLLGEMSDPEDAPELGALDDEDMWSLVGGLKYTFIDIEEQAMQLRDRIGALCLLIMELRKNPL